MEQGGRRRTERRPLERAALLEVVEAVKGRRRVGRLGDELGRRHGELGAEREEVGAEPRGARTAGGGVDGVRVCMWRRS